jgi:hypothetical protein
MPKTFTSSECKTKGCEHVTVLSEYCRYCDGRRHYEEITALRSALGFLGLRVKLSGGFFGPVVKKKVAKIAPVVITERPIKQIPVGTIKAGMELASGGKVISVKPHQARKLVSVTKSGKGKYVSGGKDGLLFKTDKRVVWFPLDAKVWVFA